MTIESTALSVHTIFLPASCPRLDNSQTNWQKEAREQGIIIINMTTGTAAIRRLLWKNDRWIISLAMTVGMSATVATIYACENEDEKHQDYERLTSMWSGLSWQRMQLLQSIIIGTSSVRCEAAQNSSYEVDGLASLIHRNSVTTRLDLEKKNLLHKRSSILLRKQATTMSEKYIVDYDTILGQGAYGRVHPAKCITTGEPVALKRLPKRFTNSTLFNCETNALLRIYENGGHPNISGLRDMYDDANYYYLFIDLAQGGEMFDHLIQNGQYSEFDASRLVTEILSALAFLHNIGVTHADLKPENILLCSKIKGAETVKIIDFGCAIVDERGISGRSPAAATTALGTKAYWSPERFTKGGVTTEAADIYAVGIILFIMLVGCHPFDPTSRASEDEIETLIRNGKGPPMNMTMHLSPSARDFIKRLMDKDPNRRLTAISALEHPWIRGITPTVNVIKGSDTKLLMYQDLRDKLSSGIFAALVDSANLRDMENNANGVDHERSLTHLLKEAFEKFDEDGKGYVSEADLGRVMSKVNGTSLSATDGKNMITAARDQSLNNPSTSLGLSLSDFSQVFSRLGHEHYQRGDFVYKPGDIGDKMFFINSGKVDILTNDGHLVATLKHGDTFGEGSLLEDRYRNTTAKCATPVSLIAVSKTDVNKYLGSSSIKRSLKLRWNARTLAQAKNLIRIQTNVTKRNLHEGDVVYNEGDTGKSIYIVDDGTLDVTHNGTKMHNLSSGDSFGESSILFQRPRSSTVVCASTECNLHEMRGSDFRKLLDSDPGYAQALGDICRKRMLQKAIKSYLISSGLNINDLEKVFRDADKDRSGTLDLNDLSTLMSTMGKNSTIPDKDLKALLQSLDLDDDGQVTLTDVIEMMKSFK
jgi:serine/threonine protein kinase